MKRLLLLVLLGVLPVWLAGCGYQNPYLVAKREDAGLKGKAWSPVALHIEMWQNQTNQLGLPLVFYNALSTRFLDSDLVTLTQNDRRADYILDGRISAINEGLTRGTVLLTVGYGLKDLKSGKMVWQVPTQTFSQSFYITDDAASTEDNKQQALDTISDDLARIIYMRAISVFRHSLQAAPPATPAAGPAKKKSP